MFVAISKATTGGEAGLKLRLQHNLDLKVEFEPCLTLPGKTPG